MSASNGFELSALIEHTANELRKAQASVESKGAKPVLQFSGCEIELAVTVSAEAGGGIKFWVVDTSAKVAGETVSKIKLSFGGLTGSRALQFLQARDGDNVGPANP